MRCSSGQRQIVLVILIILHIFVIKLHGGDGGDLRSAAKGNGLSVLNILIVGLGIAVRLRLGLLILLEHFFGNGLGPLDMLGLVGCLGCTADGAVEPALLLPLGICQIQHQAVEEVGVPDQQAEVMVGPGSLLGELAAGGVGEVVGLRDAHLLLLGRW